MWHYTNGIEYLYDILKACIGIYVFSVGYIYIYIYA